MQTCTRRLTHVWAFTVLAFAVFAAHGISGQIEYSSGQEVVPDFAGWETNTDGSFNMVFGYMNRNYEEHSTSPSARTTSSSPEKSTAPNRRIFTRGEIGTSSASGSRRISGPRNLYGH